MMDYNKLEKSLKHLQLQYKNYLSINEKDYLEQLDKEAIGESVIQRFETCYDCLWKTLKRYLIEEKGVVDIPNSPKPVFRIAGENRLFSSPVEQWIRYANARINTSHDYSEDKFSEALKLMQDFISDTINLYVNLTGKTWQ